MPTTNARSALMALALVAGALAASCGAAQGPDELTMLGFIGIQETTEGVQIEHVDINGDQKPDIWRYYRLGEAPATGQARPRVLFRKDVDLNFDGRLDVEIHVDPDGVVTREAFDLDFDGRVDMISEYRQGTLVRQALDDGFDGIVDVWRYFDGGLLVRKERDTDGDGRVDLWEYYEDGKLIRVGRDIDRDGRPELFEEEK